MNPTRFDDLTKALAAATSRRQAIKAIGAALGGALGFSSIGIANAASCKDFGHNCAKNQDCCSNFCCGGICCSFGHCYHGVCRPG